MKHRAKLYNLVAARLRRAIEQSIWRHGDRLPSLDEIAASNSVSLITVRKAIALLEEERLVERRHGSGTYVTAAASELQPITLRFERAWSFIDIPHLEATLDLVEQGWTDAPPRVFGESFKLASSYRFIRRIHRQGDRPYAIVEVYLAKAVYDAAPHDFDTIPAMQVLPRLNHKIAGGRQLVTIRSADEQVAELLKIDPIAPIGDVHRVVHDAEGLLLLIGHVTYRGDIVRIDTAWTNDAV